MRVMPLGLVAAAALVSACGGNSDPWLAEASHATDATAGTRSELAKFYEYGVTDESCFAVASQMEVIEQGALGTATIGPATEVIEDPEGPCDGYEAEATAVYYEAASDVAGIDTVVVREFKGGAEPDRIHTLSVRVR